MFTEPMFYNIVLFFCDSGRQKERKKEVQQVHIIALKNHKLFTEYVKFVKVLEPGGA